MQSHRLGEANTARPGMESDGEEGQVQRRAGGGVNMMPGYHQRATGALKFNVCSVSGPLLCIVKRVYNYTWYILYTCILIVDAGVFGTFIFFYLDTPYNQRQGLIGIKATPHPDTVNAVWLISSWFGSKPKLISKIKLKKTTFVHEP